MSMSQLPELCRAILLSVLLTSAFMTGVFSMLLGIMKLIEKARDYKEMLEETHRWVTKEGYRLKCEMEEMKGDREQEG